MPPDARAWRYANRRKIAGDVQQGGGRGRHDENTPVSQRRDRGAGSWTERVWRLELVVADGRLPVLRGRGGHEGDQDQMADVFGNRPDVAVFAPACKAISDQPADDQYGV